MVGAKPMRAEPGPTWSRIEQHGPEAGRVDGNRHRLARGERAVGSLIGQAQANDSFVSDGHTLRPPPVEAVFALDIRGDRWMTVDVAGPCLDEVTPVIPAPLGLGGDHLVVDLGFRHPCTASPRRDLLDQRGSGGRIPFAGVSHALADSTFEALVLRHLNCFRCPAHAADDPRSSASCNGPNSQNGSK